MRFSHALKSMIKFCFDRWWIPLTFTFLSGLIFVFSHFVNSPSFEKTAFYILMFSWIFLMVSTIFQLANKKWIQGIVSGVFFIGILGALIFYAVARLFIQQTRPDRFTDDLYIPDNIKIENPIDLPYSDSRRPDNIAKIKKSKTDFVLYNSFQPGLYEYDLWTGKIEKGVVYLKAYEVTKNCRLSPDRVEKQSMIRISNNKDTFVRFSSNGYFTIYEGDWGKPYAARFEIWFKPDNGGKARKLAQKNFKIEGWMR